MTTIKYVCENFNLPEELETKILLFSTHPVAQIFKDEENHLRTPSFIEYNFLFIRETYDAFYNKVYSKDYHLYNYNELKEQYKECFNKYPKKGTRRKTIIKELMKA